MEDFEKRKDLIRVCYSPDTQTAEQMIAQLKQHNIQAVRHGGTRDIYQIGKDLIGEEIMVAPEDLPEARQILREMTGDESPESSADHSVPKTILSLVAALILLIVLLLLRSLL